MVPQFIHLVALLTAMRPISTREDRSNNESDTTRLVNDLMARYDKRVRPNAHTDQPVIVHMSIVLGILTEIKENQQIAAFVISHIQRWHDEKLRFDPSKYNGINQVVIPQSLVWVPKLFIYNSMDTKNMLTDDLFDVRVYHDGIVKINIPQFVNSICRINIELFPFDTQFCAVALASPLLSVHEMDVNATQPPRDSYFSGNAEWEVMNVTVRQMKFLEDGEYRVEVHYILHLNRRPIYYIIVIVIPTFLISALSILGIFSPGSSDGPRNEKVSLGLGSLLAMTVLLDIVAAAMPKSNSIPLLGYYIMLTILVNAISVAVSMALLGLARNLIQTESLPGSVIYTFLLLKQPKYAKVNGIISSPPEKFSTTVPRFPDLIAIYNQLIDVSRAQKIYREKIEKEKAKKKLELQWNFIFGRVDLIFLFIFESLNLLVLLLFLRYAFYPVPPLPDNFSV